MLVHILAALFGGAFAVFYTTPALVAAGLIERFGPVYGARPRLRSWLKGFAFQVVGVSIGNLLVIETMPFTPTLHPLWPAMWPVLAFVFSDFLHYWEHRIEHWLFWRFHAVHHSTEDLCSASNFHHFSDSLIFALVYGLPLSIVTKDPLAVGFVGSAVQFWATFTHSPTRLGIGPLSYIFQDNRLHRIHHSAEQRHWEKNFGAVFQVWDVMFGTSYRPSAGEWPKTGIREHGEIETIWDFLTLPFRPRKRLSVEQPAE